MKILAIYRHYSPDTAPYAPILKTILQHVGSRGHETCVYTAQPGYNDRRDPAPRRERVAGVDVRRVGLLPERKRWGVVGAINSVYFLVRAVIHALTHRYDLVIAGSHPPVFMGCALRVIQALTGTPYIYHCLDVHPEVAVLVGDVRRAWLQRLLIRLDTATCRNAVRVVVPSHDVAQALAARGLSLANIIVIRLPAPAFSRSTSEQAPVLPRDPSVTRFLFAGNLGRFQGLERIIEAARKIAAKARFELIFMGDGAAKQALIKQAGELAGRQILFLPHQSAEAAFAAMRACDYGVVSLLPDVYRYAYPSKTAAYLAAGCPLVAVVEPQSELARTIRRDDLGYVAATHSPEDIAGALMLAACERELWSPARRLNIARFAVETFGEARMLAAWDELLDGRPAGELLRAAA